MTEDRMTPFMEDILRETMNIGGAHAVTALAKMASEPIDISLPDIALKQIEEVADLIGSSEKIVSVILHHVVGDIAGYIVMSFSEPEACELAKHIRKCDEEVSEEKCLETLAEVGNVISGSCFSALNKFLGLRFDHSVPGAATDMTGALINSVLAEMGQRTNDALIAQLHFAMKQMPVHGSVFLIIDPDSTQRILQAANKKLHS